MTMTGERHNVLPSLSYMEDYTATVSKLLY